MNAGPALLEAGEIPRTPSRHRVEIVIARSAAAFGAVFYLQALFSLAEQETNLHPVWVVVVAVGLGLGIVLAALCTLARRRQLRVTAVFAVVYLLSLLSWPFAVVDATAGPSDSFWLYYLLTLATVMAALAFPLPVAVGYLLLVPTIYGIIRVTPVGGSSPADLAALDVVYAVLLGGFVTIVTAVLRSSATAVDRARTAALERYRAAVRSHATASERMEVDSLVHDSVLTTLLAAARSGNAEGKALVTLLAGAAIERLDEALAPAPPPAARVGVEELAARLRTAAQDLARALPLEPGGLAIALPVDSTGLADRMLPHAVADALHGATLQAMLNSAQHAGAGARRWVRLRAAEAGAIEIEVGDTGVGFDVDALPAERIGVRVSILERVAGVGGQVELESHPGQGTRVRMTWSPSESAASDPTADVSAETP